MQTREKLELVRNTKLDVAQWITSGLATCSNPQTSLCLARYAAAQLESAALIPRTAAAGSHLQKRPSLLRRELQKPGRVDASDSVAVLTRVSRAMLAALAGNSSNARRQALMDKSIVRLISQETNALKHLRVLSRA